MEEFTLRRIYSRITTASRSIRSERCRATSKLLTGLFANRKPLKRRWLPAAAGYQIRKARCRFWYRQQPPPFLVCGLWNHLPKAFFSGLRSIGKIDSGDWKRAVSTGREIRVETGVEKRQPSL